MPPESQLWPEGAGAPPCFLRGTRIRTSDGYRPIESLSAGDLLPTTFGDLQPIKRVDSYEI